MKRSIRPTTSADVPAMGALFNVGDVPPNLSAQMLDWKYWQYRADWQGARSYVLASDSELFAHGGIAPGMCAWGSNRVSTIHVIDWFARGGAAGAGTAVMKFIAQQAQTLLAIGGSLDTLRILPHLGFRPVGVATAYARPLFPSRLLRSDGVRGWRRWPRAARSVAWCLAAPSSRRSALETRRLPVEDIQRIASVLPVPRRATAVLERSVDLFSHILRCPGVPTALFAVERSGIARGYFLLAFAPGQVRIADCWIDSDEPTDWRALIFCAVDAAKSSPQAAEVVGLASDSIMANALKACGFHARFGIPIQVRATATAAIPTSPLRVQMLDNDAYFLHQGRNEFWA